MDINRIPKKAYIIRNSENPLSIEYSLTAAESCKDVGLEYEFVEGFYYKSPDELWSNDDVVTDYRKEMIFPDASCNASHIKVWKMIRDRKETAVIFEHDGIMLQPINIPIPDYQIVALGYKLFDINKYDHKTAGEPREIKSIPKHFGAHAYAMTYKTAELLLDELKNDLRMTTSIDSTYFMKFNHNSKVNVEKAGPKGQEINKIYAIVDWVDEDSVNRVELIKEQAYEKNIDIELVDMIKFTSVLEFFKDEIFGVRSLCCEMIPYNGFMFATHFSIWEKIYKNNEVAAILGPDKDLNGFSNILHKAKENAITVLNNNNSSESYAITSNTAKMLLDEIPSLDIWESLDDVYFKKTKMISDIPLGIMDPTPAIGWVRKSTVWASSWVENAEFIDSFRDNYKEEKAEINMEKIKKRKLKLAFLDTVGTPYNGDTLNYRGLGGSESAIIYLGQELTKIGFEVTVFNKCDAPGTYGGVKYIDLSDVHNNTEEFDVLITSRSVLPYAPDWLGEDIYNRYGYDINIFKPLVNNSLYKVLWLHDTFILGEDLVENILADGFFDEIYTLSDFHSQYIPNANHGNEKRLFEAFKRKIFQTRNGIKSYYDETDISAKDPDLFVYNASVTKGMVPLLDEVWPVFNKEFPNTKLKIIGGYYRISDTPDEIETLFFEKKKQYEGKYNIEFTGIVTQKEVADIYQKASYFVYPAAFPETFGISATEALNYNVPLITNRFGALEETAPEDTSYLCEFPITRDLSNYDRNHSKAEPNQLRLFLEKLKLAYTDKYLTQQKMYAANKYKPFLGWDTVALQWKHHILRKLGLYLGIEEEKKFRYITSNIHKLYKRRFVNEDEYFEDYSFYNKNDIVVVSPVYNAEKYIASHILSVASQLYTQYKHYIIDDISTDNTYQIAEDTINSLPEDLKKKFVLIKNTDKKYALGNQVEILKTIEGNPIVMLLDGDDKLVNDPDIFNYYNMEYEKGIKFTYGSCYSMADDINLYAQNYPKEVHKNKSYRSHQFNWGMPYTHLRTFRKELFDNTDHSNFLDENGNYWKAGGDNALFYPLIEQCEEQEIMAVGRVTMIYNDINPLNDYKVNAEEQTENKNRIVGRNMENNKDIKRILIGVPTAKNIETDTFKSIYNLIKPDGVEVHLEFFYGYNIDQVRNLMAHFTIENKFDYIFFVDSDMVLPKDALVKLYESKKDIVSGLYRQRKVDQKIAEVHMNGAHVIDENFFKDKKYIKVDSVGFGGILIKREVLEKIGYPQFVYYDTIDFGKTMSEDTDFCIKAKNAGYEILVMPEVKYGHITSTILNW